MRNIVDKFTKADEREVKAYMRLKYAKGYEVYDATRGNEPYRIKANSVFEIRVWESEDYSDEGRPIASKDYYVDILVRDAGSDVTYDLASGTRSTYLERYEPKLKEDKKHLKLI